MQISPHFFEINFGSIVALVVAIVSGVFSYIGVKRNTKPQMLQPLFDTLAKKRDILSQYIDNSPHGDQEDLDLTKEEDQVKSAESFRKAFEYRDSIFMNQGDLFTECKKQYESMRQEREAISKSREYQTLLLQFKDHLDMVNLEPLSDAPNKDFHQLINAMEKFSKDVDTLLRAERAATMKRITDLSLK